MAYATQPDIEARFGDEQLLIAADREGSGSLADPTVVATIAAALTAADEEIDSYVGVLYDLPLAETPGILKRLCCDLAMYHLSIDRPSMTEDKEKRYEAAVAWLGKLAAKKVTLGTGATGNTEQINDQVESCEIDTTSVPDRLFTRSTMSRLF
ncbi:MAG: DUF1320 domain-containing protein [Phycisphaerales bacterium]|jgi:phage gp36-like protein